MGLDVRVVREEEDDEGNKKMVEVDLSETMEAYDYNTSIKRLLSDRSSDRDDEDENDAPEVFSGDDAEELQASGFSEVSDDDMDMSDSDFADDNEEE